MLQKFLIQSRRLLPGRTVLTDEQQAKARLRQEKESHKPDEFTANHDIILAYFRCDPIINACVNVTVDNVVGDGTTIETLSDTPEAELHKMILESFFDKNHKLQLIRNIATTAVIFDDVYAEIIENDFGYPSRIYVLDTETIRPIVDEKGNLVEYQQKIKEILAATLLPQSIMHFSLSILGSRKTGISTIESALLSAASKRYAELFNARYFENQKPRIVWTFPRSMGEKDYNENVDAIIAAKKNPQTDIFLWGSGIGGENGIDWKALTGQEEMQFNQYIAFLRQQIFTAMLVPPILLGIPEGSNRANAEIQMQTFDRRVRAIQAVIEDAINRHIIKRFGFTDVVFKFDRSGRHDLLKDVQIANSMRGFATLNEVRKAAGLESLDPEKFPDSEKIWNGASNIDANPFKNEPLRTTPNESPYFRFIKVLEEGERRPPEHPITDQDEERMSSILANHILDVKKESLKQITAEYTKDLNGDPQDILKRILALFTTAQIKNDIDRLLKEAYDKGVQSVEKETDQNFLPDVNTLNAIQNYGFDLVQGMNDDLKAKLQGVLHRATLDGQSISTIKQQINDSIDVSSARAERIARTEMNRAANAGRINAYQQAGVKNVKWIAVIDQRTSPICRELDGKIMPIGEAFTAVIEGQRYQAIAPPIHPNCRSTIVALN